MHWKEYTTHILHMHYLPMLNEYNRNLNYTQTVVWLLTFSICNKWLEVCSDSNVVPENRAVYTCQWWPVRLVCDLNSSQYFAHNTTVAPDLAKLLTVMVFRIFCLYSRHWHITSCMDVRWHPAEPPYILPLLPECWVKSFLSLVGFIFQWNTHISLGHLLCDTFAIIRNFFWHYG